MELLKKTVTTPVLEIFFIIADSYRLGFLVEFLATLMIGGINFGTVVDTVVGGNGRTLILNVETDESGFGLLSFSETLIS